MSPIMSISASTDGKTWVKLTSKATTTGYNDYSVTLDQAAGYKYMVNVDIGFMTGQTLPLISDGRFAFIMFCTAFGIILSISKIAKKERDEAQAQLEREKNEN